MVDPEKDIFNINLNKEGAAWILRFCNMVQVIILISIFSGLLSILHNGLRIEAYNPGLYVTRPALKYEYLVHPYFWITYDLIWMVQVYLYFRFRNEIKKAVNIADAKAFNYSFSYLYKMTKLSLVLLILNFVSLGYSLFLHFIYHY